MQASKAILLCVFSLLFTSNYCYAQSKKSIILIDGVATEVMLASDGAIEQIIRELPNYMSDYQAGQRASNAQSGMTHETTRPADSSLDPQSSSSYGNTNTRYDDQLSSVGAFRVIYFESGTATLSEATIMKLDEIAEEQLKVGNLVMLNTACKANLVETSKLSENRIQGCKDYLIFRGVPEGNVVVSIEENHQPSAKVNVYLK